MFALFFIFNLLIMKQLSNLWLLAIGCFLAIPVVAQQRVEVTVTDLLLRRPLPGVSVFLQNSGTKSLDSARTNATGKAQFANVSGNFIAGVDDFSKQRFFYNDYQN